VTLQERVAQLIAKHGSLRAAARAIQVDHAYLSRLGSGEKVRPLAGVLKRMGIRRVVDYQLERKP